MKRSEEIEIEIERSEHELYRLEMGLDEKIPQFAAGALPPAVAVWMNDEAKRRIEANAVRLEDIGIEKLGRLKTELAELISRLPELAVNAVADEQKWPHRKRVHPNAWGSVSTRTDYFNEVFRSLINNLGPLLAKYDLLQDPHGLGAAWVQTGTQAYRYVYNPGFDPRNVEVLVEYTEIRRAQIQKAGELAQQRQQLMKARAGELWDSI